MLQDGGHVVALGSRKFGFNSMAFTRAKYDADLDAILAESSPMASTSRRLVVRISADRSSVRGELEDVSSGYAF